MYDERYGTDWDSISLEEAIDRAYALGVSEVLGEDHDDEYERLEAVAESNYEKSMIELSYQDGQNEAAGVYDDHEKDERVWGELVEGEDHEVTTAEEPDHDEAEPDPAETDRDSRSAVTRGEMIDRREQDSTDAVSKPDFLERE